MTFSRRDALKYSAFATSGAALGLPFVDSATSAESIVGSSGPKRFVFFLFSNGFHPKHVCPSDLSFTADKLIDVDLASNKLPQWSQPLEKYQDRLTILHGVHGRHLTTSHGTPFGCLAGVAKGTTPRAQTIDHALGQALPVVPLPMLGIGLGGLQTMKSQAINYSSSAAGVGRPVPMYSDPRMLYQNVFGCVADGKSRDAFLAETAGYERLIERSAHLRRQLAGDEAAKFDTYIDGLRQTIQQREALAACKESLAKFKPAFTEAFDHPQHTGDWWEANIDVGVAALRAGVTNVLTIDAGLSGPDNMPLDTLVKLHKEAGHEKTPASSHMVGHTDQINDPYWLTARHYTWKLLERILEPLATTPEPNGKGTMLDNTLVVYTSDSGEVQHSVGIHWPFLLIGNLGGRIRSGRFIQLPSWGPNVGSLNGGPIAKPAFEKRPHDGRTINALWTALLHAAGKKVDGFNLDVAPPGIDRPGPLEVLLA